MTKTTITFRFLGSVALWAVLLMLGAVTSAWAQQASFLVRVVADDDCDGTLSGFESPLANWNVFVDEDEDGERDAQEPTQVSDGAGFAFLTVDPGTLHVWVERPEDWVPTLPAAGFHEVVLEANEHADLPDLGNVRGGTVLGQKFEDLDGDGSFEPLDGETPLEGVEITLRGVNCAGTEIALTDTTDDDGVYKFEKVPPGDDYELAETPQPNWHQTAPPDNGTHSAEVTSGATVFGGNFGNQRDAPEGEIHGYKFEDRNGNGLQDEDEPRIAGWTIYLDLNFNGEHDNEDRTAVTDENGEYWFENLPQGDYQVREVQQDGWRQTSAQPTVFFLPDGQSVTGVFFGNQGAGSIHGLKFEDENRNAVRDNGEPGLAGVTIYIDTNGNTRFDEGEPVAVSMGDDPATPEDETGRFWFNDLPPGDHQVLESIPEGWEQTTPQHSAIELGPGEQVDGVLFGNVPTDDGQLPPWDYGDAPDDGGAGSYRTLHDNGGPRHRVIEEVYLGAMVDREGNGQPTPNASGDDDNGIDDEDGVSFDTAILPGSSASITVTASAEGFLTAWVDFDASGTFDLTDRIFDQKSLKAGENSLSFNVPSTADLTKLFARFRFTQKRGFLKPTGPVLDGEVEDYKISGPPLVPGVGSIHGFKFEDVNVNGIYDPGEPHLDDWEIYLDLDRDGRLDLGEPIMRTLDDKDGMPVDSTGLYWFKDLPPGTYRVRERLKAGWLQTFPPPGFYDITIEAGEKVDSVIFGNAEYGEVRGRKFEDLNHNNQIDEREPGRGRWRIDLLLDDDPPPDDQDITVGLPIICNEGEHFLERCPAGRDEFPAVLLLTFDLDLDGEADLTDLFSGRIMLRRDDAVDTLIDDPALGTLDQEDGQADVVRVELVSVETDGNPGWFSNAGFRLQAGDGSDNLANDGPLHTMGALVEREDNPRLADSFFDLFFELDPHPTLELPRLRNEAPLRVSARLAEVFTPDAKWHDVLYRTGPLALVDDQGAERARILDAVLTPSEPGTYEFLDLPPIPLPLFYTVREQLKTGWEFSVPLAGGFHDFNISSGEVIDNLNFANVELATIRGQVFDDVNTNGVRDDGEPAVNGFFDHDGDGQLDPLTLQLIDVQGNVFAFDAADLDLNKNNQIEPETERGVFQFIVLPGAYRLQQAHPLQGITQTMPADAGDYDIEVGNGELYDELAFGNTPQNPTAIEAAPEAGVPTAFRLHANYPNPFNPETTIRFDVRESARVVLKVFNLLGREVATLVNAQHAPGRHEVRFDATGLPSGTYFYRVEMGDFRDVKMMILVK